MPVKVLIPTPLRPYTGQQAVVEIAGDTVGELLQNLTLQHADLRPHLFSPDGKLRSFVNIYLNDEDIRYLKREQTLVSESDTVSIVPSVAGGAPIASDWRRRRRPGTSRNSPTTTSSATAGI